MGEGEGEAGWPGNHAVYHEDFRRLTLYAWVTDEQAEQLRNRRVLLGRPAGKGRSRLDARLADDKNPTSLAVARALRKAGLKARRSAWVNPWGMALGVGDEKPGSRLIKVTLRPDVIIGKYEPGAEKPWVFVDQKGEPRAPGKVLARPESLGAVYHVTRPADGGVPLREYVLLNEDLIASWSIETGEIDKELADAIERLGALPPATPSEGWAAHLGQTAWSAPREGASALDLLDATLASGDDVYHPSRREALLDALRAARRTAHPLEIKAPPASSASGPFADLTAKGVQKKSCTEHGSFVRCAPLPPSNRRAHDGRFCVDDNGKMIKCPPRK